jgi:hypothetical protein
MNDCQKRGHRKLFITCEDCHQVINQATFKEANDWISVKDRLPEVKEGDTRSNWVLVLTRDSSRYVADFNTKGSWHCNCNCREGSYADEDGNDVTHWMPLPEPPK